MVRYFECSNRYKYNWEQVVRAFWCRYPNPFSEHVLSEDVIDRFVDKKGRLFTKRFLSKTNRMPKLAGILLGESISKVVYIIEESLVDPLNTVFVTYTRNIAMQRIMCVDEKVTYRRSSVDSQWTVEERKAMIKSSVFASGQIEAFGVNRFRQNVSKTYKGFQMVLEAMYSKYSNLETNNIESISRFHPLLKNILLEKAKNLKEVAKSKAVPIVSAATNMSTNREERQ